MRVTAKTIIDIMTEWVGLDRADGSHKPIIDTYNSFTPYARGHKATMTDSYCDITVSAAFIKAGAVDMLGGTECGVEEHIKIFKKKGIWEEDGTIIPKPGYIITYNWDLSTQPNDGYADHIGVVKSIEDGTIFVIEGNYNGRVSYRKIPIGAGFIRGYAIPNYLPEEVVKEKYYKPKDIIKPEAYVGPDFVVECTSPGLKITNNSLLIRNEPDFSVRDRWYKTSDGYISAYKVCGFVYAYPDGKDSDFVFWYERDNHDCPSNCILTIDGSDYIFDKNGYGITPNRVSPLGVIKYEN